MSAHDNCLPAALFYPTGSLPPPPPPFHVAEGKSPFARSPLVRPDAHPPSPKYDAAGREKYYTRFRGSLRCHRHTSRPRYGGRPPNPVQQWRRRRSPLKGALGEGGSGGGGCSGGGVERSRARLTGTRGGGGGSAAGRRAGGTPPPRDCLGARARSIRETIPLSLASLPRHSHTPDRWRLSPCFTLFSHICILFFFVIFPTRRR